MATKRQLALITRIRHALPLGYELSETGAPRGERRFWTLTKAGNIVKGSFRLGDIAADKLNTNNSVR